MQLSIITFTIPPLENEAFEASTLTSDVNNYLKVQENIQKIPIQKQTYKNVKINPKTLYKKSENISLYHKTNYPYLQLYFFK